MSRSISCLLFLMVLLVTTMSKAQTQKDTRDLLGFTGIKVSNSIEAELVKGDQPKIEIIASGIELSRIESTVKDNILEVRISGSRPRASSIKAVITYQELEEIAANTNAKIFVEDLLDSKRIILSAATSSYVEAVVKAENLLLEAETNSKIFVKGNAENLNFNAFTNAEIDGNGLEVENAEVRINTNASGSFHVKQSIKGSAATRGRIKYTGNPNVVDIKTNTGGSIEGN